MDLLQFLNIDISRITPDPDQPRRFFEEGDLQELTSSVKINGVIQPILLRPKDDDGYIIVCGERRYRASIAAGLTTIPAVVRDLTDEQALELQIIENLQRKDVHPMEEAVAFKSLLEKKNFSVQEIAGRLAKSEFYVRQRLKLNELTSDWQKVFFQNIISLTDAMQICLLPAKSQSALFKEEKDSLKPGGRYKLSSYTLDNFKGDLHRAPFDLRNASLDKKAGACTNCQYNTSVSLLFPDHAHSPRCTNVSCFKRKCDAHLNSELKIAIEDPTVVLVSYEHSDNELVKKLKSEGHIVLRVFHDFSSVEEPSKPDFQELKDEWEYEIEEGERTIQDLEEEFSELTARYEKNLQAYNKKIESGKYKKAFVVSGSQETGKYIYIEFKQKAQEKAAKAAVSKGGDDVPESDIKTEIERLKTREERSKELDSEKVHKRIVDELVSSEVYYNNGSVTLTTNELIGLAVYFSENSGFDNNEWFRKRADVPRHSDWNKVELYKTLSADPEKFIPDIFRLIRRSLSHNLRTENDSPETKGTAAALRAIANDYIPGMVSVFESEQKQIADRRTAKVEKRISELTKQLTPAPKKTALKSNSGKKSALAKGISSLLNNEQE